MKPIYSSFRQSFERDIYRFPSNVIAAPVASIPFGKDSADTLARIMPQAMFLSLNSSLSVVDADGREVSSLYDALSLSNRFIPFLCVGDEKTVRSLSDFVYFNALADAAVCVKYSQRSLYSLSQLISPWLRGMVDCRELGKLSRSEWLRIIGDVWEVRAISVLISDEQCSRATVDLLHERLLSVWVCSSDGVSAALSGADGVLIGCDALSGFYEFLDLLPENTLLDNYRVLAHKGFQDGYTEPENSTTAIKKGADYHLDGAEIDLKLSTDGIPFIIHNPTTRGMLKGEDVPVESLSSDELASRERTDFPGEYTDRLEDMLRVLQPYENYPIFLEFKNFSIILKK